MEKRMKWHRHGPAMGTFFFAFIGALIYFLQQADSFGAGLVAIVKAIVWPGLLVYHLLGFLKV